MSKRKKILLLTLNDYVLYQPTILNLYDFLSPLADVTIVSFEPHFLTKQKENTRNVVYLKSSAFPTAVFSKVDFLISKLTPLIRIFRKNFNHNYFYYHYYLPSVLEKYLEREKPVADEVIAVDLGALLVAQKHFGSVHFLSLEIDNNTNPKYAKIDLQKVLSVFVQSEDRYRYLFPQASFQSFIVQNSPVYTARSRRSIVRKDLIWAGTISRRFAILECINFFELYAEYKLVMKGGADKKTKKIIEKKYHHLLELGRIEFNQAYLEAGAFIEFLSSFRIGFCFYSWDLIRNSFNNQTAPAGKVFMYLAAGTPIIACNIPGFKFLAEFGAGVLIDDYQPDSIRKAILEIENDYDRFSNACYKAAAHFSFDVQVKPYIDYLVRAKDECFQEAPQ